MCELVTTTDERLGGDDRRRGAVVLRLLGWRCDRHPWHVPVQHLLVRRHEGRTRIDSEVFVEAGPGSSVHQERCSLLAGGAENHHEAGQHWLVKWGHRCGHSKGRQHSLGLPERQRELGCGNAGVEELIVEGDEDRHRRRPAVEAVTCGAVLELQGLHEAVECLLVATVRSRRVAGFDEVAERSEVERTGSRLEQIGVAATLHV